MLTLSRSAAAEAAVLCRHHAITGTGHGGSTCVTVVGEDLVGRVVDRHDDRRGRVPVEAAWLASRSEHLPPAPAAGAAM
jgi:hypothetical protein